MTKQAAWTVVVAYEDAETRETAVAFCDRLVERFWTKVSFDVSWWSFDLLNKTESSREAAEKAKSAALIVFAARSEDQVPRAWVEKWLSQRRELEGAVVGLVHGGTAPAIPSGDEPVYLRTVARRAGMDYLTQVPQSISQYLPDFKESYNQRTHEVTSVLDGILHQNPPPPTLKP